MYVSENTPPKRGAEAERRNWNRRHIMTKQEYMKMLQEKLESFGQGLQEEILEDYRQHFAEGEKSGKSAEEIIEELGNIEEMIRELPEEEVPEEFAKSAMEPVNKADDAGQKVADHLENTDRNVRDTEMKRTFSYSGYYKSVVLEGKTANVYVGRSEDDSIHVEYEAKGVRSQLNYEYYQYEEDGTFYAGVKRKKGMRDESDNEDKLVKVTLFGHTIISYGNISNFSSDGQLIKLTVKVPTSVPKLNVKVGSGNVFVSGLEVESFEGSSGSGNVKLEQFVADRMKAHTGSGNISADHVEFISGNLETGSGNVNGDMIKGRDLRCGTGSGNIRLDAAVAEYQLGTGSGNIKVKAVGATERASLGTGSGGVKIELEGIKGMAATVRSGSGSIRLGWNGEEDRKVKNGTYAYGDSSCKINVTTGSGSIKVFGK